MINNSKNKKATTSKKGTNQVGIGIIVMAVLLLLGAIFIDDSNPNSKANYLDNKKNNSLGYPEESYIFYLNDTDIGRQKKVTENFPNIELGSKEEYNTIYIGNNFRLNANPFTSNPYSFDLNIDKPEDVNSILVYFKSDRISGENPVDITFGDILVQSQMDSRDSPVKIYITKDINYSNKMTFEIQKPKGYDVFNWNKLDVLDLKIVEVRQNKANNLKQFDFEVEKLDLERAYIELVVSCDEVVEISPSIKVKVNDYIISDSNPLCTSKNSRISADIPLSVLKSNKNRIEFETEGYYKMAYSFNKIYFNDEETYKFNINNFNDIIDIVMYGDFDKEIIDMKINGQIMTLKNDEIKSIIPYLRYGKNEIKFLTKPLEIEEFVIEKNEFAYGWIRA